MSKADIAVSLIYWAIAVGILIFTFFGRDDADGY